MAARAGKRKATKTPQKKVRPTTPATVPAAVLAGILSEKRFTDRWLRELADKGYLVKSGRAEYELAKSVQGYIRFIRETEVDKRVDDVTSRQQFEAERARKLKLENDVRENILLETPMAIAAIDYIVGLLRTELAGVPARASEDVATRRRVEDAINDVLNALADRAAKAGAALSEGRDPLEADEAIAA